MTDVVMDHFLIAFVHTMRALLFAVGLSAPWWNVKAFHLASTTSLRDHRPKSLFGGEPELPSFDIRDEDENEEAEATRLLAKAADLRREVRDMELELPEERKQLRRSEAVSPKDKRSRILVVGANGALGSCVCRALLRNGKLVVAGVHAVGENSFTSRGYGNLAYQVGAEDGLGSIGAAWSSDRVQSFQYNPQVMEGYNLQNLQVVELELLNPLECDTVVRAYDVDTVVFCASDFSRNVPRAVGTFFNVPLLLRAVTRPDKGSVEVDGLINLYEAWRKVQSDQGKALSNPCRFLHISVSPQAFGDDDPPSPFYQVKRSSEEIVRRGGRRPQESRQPFTILRFPQFSDSFVAEDLPLIQSFADDDANEESGPAIGRRWIHPRDAARAVVEALSDPSYSGRTVDVHTVQR
jgi:hypothetical protein